MKPNIHAIHDTLASKGIPLAGVEYQRDTGLVVAEYGRGATSEQMEMGNQIIAEWDQEVYDNAQAAGKAALPSIEAINAARVVADLKTMALALRAFIDDRI